MTARIRRDAGHAEDQRQRDRKRKAKRPCGNPPATPTGVVLTFQVTEARTHLRFTGKVKWNAVTLDEAGHGVDISGYDVQLRATNAAGAPVETEDAKTRLRAHRKAPADRVRIDAATNPSGSTFRYVLRRPHGRLVGDSIEVQNCSSPATYNGTFTVTNVVDTTTLEVNGGSSGVAACDDPGVMIDDDDRLHVITRELPRPKTWYWQARARSLDNHGCPSAWSAWTTQALPWTGADPQPPTPTGLSLSFDSKDKQRHNRWRLIVEWNEVLDWDVPGGDREDDMAAYGVQVQKSSDGASPDENAKTWGRIVTAKADTDADTVARAIRHQILKRYYYRARVRSIDRFGRRGAYTDWSAWQQPGSEAPPAPTLVTIYDKDSARVPLEWTAPADPADAEIIDRDIAYFQVHLSNSATFGSTYRLDRMVGGERRAFKIPKADFGPFFYGRVRSVNSEGDKSAWIPATIGGNSNPGSPPTGVQPGRGRRIAIPFTKNGDVEVKHYPQGFVADQTYTIIGVRARLGRHDGATHPSDGTPGGADMLVNLRVQDDAGAEVNVFSAETRLRIDSGTHKDQQWIREGDSGFNRTYIDENETLTVRVSQVGSTRAGSDLVVIVFLEAED